ncbi:MAG: DNA mismatch repair endonuclease MutL [Candidatus Pacebacteria bacterium]|nr:DNA mismatch repair endonuclease MutL [Candidatus Paceibacterota bacterium]
MSHIRILPEDLANRIAAGEVIERPASVVKELVENAIDAGAARIVVETRRGGRQLVHVTDDGCGMDRDDALLSIEAHATSKITDAYDIDRITTLGFRGEALPSIAAVSRFRLRTRSHEDVAGVELFMDGGTLRDVRDCGCPPGTSVRVQNLFHNLPARRKFLRSAKTEDQHIQEAVLLQALAHPGTAFELIMDERPVLNVGGSTDMGDRVGMLLGRDVFRAMIPVGYTEDDVVVEGFVARPGMTRSNRREQRAFVNGRSAQSDAIYFGIRDAYHTLVMKGRYPPAVLYLSMPPERVDVNVHPTKREVRFRDARTVSQIVAAAIRHALRALAASSPAPSRETLRPHGQSQPQTASHAPAPVQQQRFSQWRTRDMDPGTPVGIQPGAGGPTWDRSAEPRCNTDGPAPEEGHLPKGPSPSAATREEIRHLRVLGVFRELYLIAEGPSGLVLVDQHAAHERILFERLLASARSQDGTSQSLLLPVTVELAPADSALLNRNQDHFTRLGFAIEPFGGDTFLITGVPGHFPQENVAGMLRDILDDMRESPGNVSRPDDIRVAQAACKHAVRSEDPLSKREIDQLLRDLAEAEMPYTCPHGRPVMINIPVLELEKRFGRRH